MFKILKLKKNKIISFSSSIILISIFIINNKYVFKIIEMHLFFIKIKMISLILRNKKNRNYNSKPKCRQSVNLIMII